MKDIKYKIQFFSNWHCGSGLAAGADVDLLVIKDKNNLPFVPGKTIKGLVREALELYLMVKKQETKVEALEKAFGYFDGKDIKITGDIFFSNACLETNEQRTIIKNKLSDYLYKSISSTSIDEKGIASDHTLRKIEVVVPCTLTGSIINVDEQIYDELVESLKLIKRIGVSRNRGLGRCQIIVDNN